MYVKVLEGLGDVDPEAWDALTGDDDPFVEHAFLHALEESGSVGGKAGWLPLHLACVQGDGVVAYEVDAPLAPGDAAARDVKGGDTRTGHPRLSTP